MNLSPTITPAALSYVWVADGAFDTQTIIARQPHHRIGWLYAVVAVVAPIALTTACQPVLACGAFPDKIQLRWAQGCC
jgi:hypothetical protein